MNIIEVPFEHKMFDEEISGELENFIYDEFSLIYTEKDNIVLGFTVFFEPNIDGTEIRLVKLNEEWIKDIYYIVQLDEKSISGFSVYCSSFEEKYTKIGYSLSEIVLRTMLYIMNTPREKIQKQTKTKKENKKFETKTKTENKIYLIDEIVEYVNENGLSISKGGNHKITCPCWNVRGHYRHYKNGNVIFVKSYKKGKKKNMTPKDNIYTI